MSDSNEPNPKPRPVMPELLDDIRKAIQGVIEGETTLTDEAKENTCFNKAFTTMHAAEFLMMSLRDLSRQVGNPDRFAHMLLEHASMAGYFLQRSKEGTLKAPERQPMSSIIKPQHQYGIILPPQSHDRH